MSTTVDVELIKQKVQEMVRQSALTRIGDHSRQEEFQLIELKGQRRAGEVLGSWMSIILVTGDALRITLKLHFSYEDAKTISCAVYRADSPEGVSGEQAVDFMKELSNLMAGYIVQNFESIEIPTGISLPLCTRGFYEVFADYEDTETPLIRFSDVWRLECNGCGVYGTAMYEISNAGALQGLADFDIGQDDIDDDGFDFL